MRNIKMLLDIAIAKKMQNNPSFSKMVKKTVRNIVIGTKWQALKKAWMMSPIMGMCWIAGGAMS